MRVNKKIRFALRNSQEGNRLKMTFYSAARLQLPGCFARICSRFYITIPVEHAGSSSHAAQQIDIMHKSPISFYSLSFLIFSLQVQRSCVIQQIWKCFSELSLFDFPDIIIGTYVPQVTICQASIDPMVISQVTLRKRCVASLMEHLTSTCHVTRRMCPPSLIMKAGRHAPKLVIISLVSINLAAKICIVLRNSNAANCRLLRGRLY